MQKAREKLGFDKQGNTIAPFVSEFSTRDRVFVYKPTEAPEKEQLILYNLTRKQKIILTPENLVAKYFRIYPAGDRILFSASECSKYKPGLYEQSLYAVTTGRSSDPAQKPRTIQQILGNQDYENLKFDGLPTARISLLGGQIKAMQKIMVCGYRGRSFAILG